MLFLKEGTDELKEADEVLKTPSPEKKKRRRPTYESPIKSEVEEEETESPLLRLVPSPTKRPKLKQSTASASPVKVESPAGHRLNIPSDSGPIAAVKSGSLQQKLHCICKTPYDAKQFYVACDLCGQWFHGKW